MSNAGLSYLVGKIFFFFFFVGNKVVQFWRWGSSLAGLKCQSNTCAETLQRSLCDWFGASLKFTSTELVHHFFSFSGDTELDDFKHHWVKIQTFFANLWIMRGTLGTAFKTFYLPLFEILVLFFLMTRWCKQA